MKRTDQPVKKDTRQVGAEWTVRSILLGILLSMVLAAANAYLGLRVGMTVSASIPAAVVSMALLRLFRASGILENNLVQTAASAGEALAAGVIFTLPALVLLGHWDGFPYGPVTWIALVGGLLGVVFSVPLRRVLLDHPDLRFPEGVATAEVLKSGLDATGRGAGVLMAGGLAAAAMKVAQAGLGVVGETVKGGIRLGGGAVAGVGADLSPALLAVGYIVGFRAAGWMCAGGAFAWLIAIPTCGWISPVVGITDTDGAYAAAFAVWQQKVRFLGVGAMVVGGLWSVVALLPALAEGLRGLPSRTEQKDGTVYEAAGVEHRDAPLPVLLGGVVVLSVCLGFVYYNLLTAPGLSLSEPEIGGVLVRALPLALVGGFLFSAVAGYMAGLVGSSHNPVSGVTIATILATALLLVPVVAGGSAAGPATAMVVGAVVCCAAAISGDNLQDLKAGRLVGATPWRQQGMQVVGVVAGAVVMAPVLDLLYQAYGIGPSLPRAAMDPSSALAAPQATLMQSLAKGVFDGGLEWGMIYGGGGLALGLIAMDHWRAVRGRSGNRIPVLAVAVGLYLPVQLTVPIFLGGWLAGRAVASSSGAHRALLCAAGMIAGEALAGVALAIPFALARRDDVLRISVAGMEMIAPWLGLGCMAAAVWTLASLGTQRPSAD